jgi:hypothetical protein
MALRLARALLLVIGAGTAVHAGVITLEDTLSVSQQPPLLTGAGALFGNGGVVVADAFTAPVSATLFQIAVDIQYITTLPGVTGTSPMLLSLFADNSNSPGSLIESWTVPLSPPSDTTLTLVTVTSLTNALLMAGHEYWLSEVPTDPLHTGIGWGLPVTGIQLPIAESTTGTNSGWGVIGLNLANEFSVSGNTVPEPATLGITVLGLLSIISFRRNKHPRNTVGVTALRSSKTIF